MYLDRKLRARVQGDTECPIDYYYDILNMCRMLDENMSEERKKDYLYQGLKKSLFTEIYKRQPATCSDFLALLKLHVEASALAQPGGSRVGLVGSISDSEGSNLELVGYTNAQQSKPAPSSNSEPNVASLVQELRSLKTEMTKWVEQKPGNKSDRPTRMPFRRQPARRSGRSRTSDGRPI